MAMTSERIEAVMPANTVPGPEQGHWNYSHYAALPDDGQRYEIINGVLFMSPVPNLWHQELVGEFFSYLRTYVKLAGLGRVFMAPTDVQLAPDSIIQPDVMVVLHAHVDRLRGTRIVGAPDLVVEVASSSTATYDRREKYDMYLRADVPEYWIVDPHARTVEVRILEDAHYQLVGIFRGTDIMRSTVVPSIAEVRAEQFFATE